MAAFSEEIVEIKCDPHKILNNTYLYRFFCSKVKSFHTGQELSESVVKVSGNSKFTRLDIREQCSKHKLPAI